MNLVKATRIIAQYTRDCWWPLVRTVLCDQAQGGHRWGGPTRYRDLYPKGADDLSFADQSWHRCDRCGAGEQVRT